MGFYNEVPLKIGSYHPSKLWATVQGESLRVRPAAGGSTTEAIALSEGRVKDVKALGVFSVPVEGVYKGYYEVSALRFRAWDAVVGFRVWALGFLQRFPFRLTRRMGQGLRCGFRV